MNRGKRKVFVTVALIVTSIVAALLLELAGGGSSGAAASPNHTASSTPSAQRSVHPPSGSTSGAVAATFRTLGANVNLRAAPSTTAGIIAVIAATGSPVVLTCCLRGTSVSNDPWWYRATYANSRGYLTGFWLNTGPDPVATHLPTC